MIMNMNCKLKLHSPTTHEKQLKDPLFFHFSLSQLGTQTLGDFVFKTNSLTLPDFH